VGLILLTASGCADRDPDDDSAADDIAGDDDVVATDICDDHPDEVLCDGLEAVTCDEHGDVGSVLYCDETTGPLCASGLGCVHCLPGTRWCEGSDVVECEADGGGTTTVETCDASVGDTCVAGACITLCEWAEAARSSIGCRFYGVDLEQYPDDHVWLPYAIAMSNVDETFTADVRIDRLTYGAWDTFAERAIEPGSLAVVELPNAQLSGTDIGDYAYRIDSDVPLIAYQFNPLDGVDSYSSDASLLLPTSAWDTEYLVPSWPSDDGSWGELVVVAAENDTEVVVLPAADTAAGGPVPAGYAGLLMEPIVLDEGDVLQIRGTGTNPDLEGSSLESTKPVGVFASHMCASCPVGECCCDHLEEQVFGLQTWGTEYVAARLPVRRGTVEPVYWRLLAGNQPTTLTFEAGPGVTGLPGATLDLVQGESVELEISGDAVDPGDFRVTGTEAFLAVQYMGSTGEPGDGHGDPCMAQAVPTEQYLDAYVVLVPETWENDLLVLVRQSGSTTTVDGTDVDAWEQGTTSAEVPPYWEIVRIVVDDGVHVLTGSTPFGVLVAGYDQYDSYCYPGGLDQQLINDL
jgi:hypothetical protein